MKHSARSGLGVVVAVLALATGCGSSNEPTYANVWSCFAWMYAPCAEAREPMVYRDGDPFHDVCAVLRRLDFPAILTRAGDGVTRLTAAHDDEGRVIEYIAECGRAEPFVATFEWGPDGRLARYRAPWDEDIDIEIVPLYQDGRLAAHDVVSHYADGTSYSFQRSYSLDDQGRILLTENVNARTPSRMTLAYDGDRLASTLWEGEGLGGSDASATTTFAYQDDGRLVERVHSYDQGDTSVDSVEWTSETTAHVSGEHGTSDVEIDENGRLVHIEVHDLEGRRDGTLTWEWDEGGRLVEFWMYGE